MAQDFCRATLVPNSTCPATASRNADPDLARRWAGHDVSDPEPLTRRFHRPEGTRELRPFPVRTPAVPVSIVLHLRVTTAHAASAAPDVGR